MKNFVAVSPDYDETDEDKTQKQIKLAGEQLTTYVYLVNSDQVKYGTVIKGLNSQKALNNDKFPKTMVERIIVLSTHRFDNAKPQNHNRNNSQKREKENKNNNNDKNKNDEHMIFSFAQMEGKCGAAKKVDINHHNASRKIKFQRQNGP